MRRIRLHFWLLAMDVFNALRWRRAYFWAIGRASAATDWYDPPTPEAQR